MLTDAPMALHRTDFASGTIVGGMRSIRKEVRDDLCPLPVLIVIFVVVSPLFAHMTGPLAPPHAALPRRRVPFSSAFFSGQTECPSSSLPATLLLPGCSHLLFLRHSWPKSAARSMGRIW